MYFNNNYKFFKKDENEAKEMLEMLKRLFSQKLAKNKKNLSRL